MFNFRNYFLDSGFKMSEICLVCQKILNEELNFIIFSLFFFLFVFFQTLNHFLLSSLSQNFKFTHCFGDHQIPLLLRIVIVVKEFVEILIFLYKIISNHFIEKISQLFFFHRKIVFLSFDSWKK